MKCIKLRTPWQATGGYSNIGYLSETQLKLKSRESSFAHDVLLSCQIALKLYTEHGSVTAVLCAKFQNHLAN